MNMTGDPNQRSKTQMFGFECSYPSPGVDFPRFQDRTANLNPLATTGTGMEDRAQCLFSTNSSSPFPTNDSIRSPAGNVPYAAGYPFPFTSAENVPPYNNAFSFTQQGFIPPTENSYAVPENSLPVLPAAQNAVSFLGSSHLNWPSNVKPTFSFSVHSSLVPTNTSSFSLRPLTGSFGCKRKNESPPIVPLKQHITEERMAEHMSRLHISSQTPASTEESKPVRERRLYMCEEMQRLQTESIIPAQILEKVRGPCTALVPWRPPIVLPNNNNEEEPDNNVTERSDSNVMDMDS